MDGAARGVLASRFYEKVLTDPTLQPCFLKIDMDKLRLLQSAFLATAFGDPPNPFPQIGPEQFDRTVDHMVESLLEFGATEEEIFSVVDSLVRFKAQVVSR
ncbi:MAG: hypothetical protein ACOY93_19615 [Bacillota bacterium]